MSPGSSFVLIFFFDKMLFIVFHKFLTELPHRIWCLLNLTKRTFVFIVKPFFNAV